MLGLADLEKDQNLCSDWSNQCWITDTDVSACECTWVSHTSCALIVIIIIIISKERKKDWMRGKGRKRKKKKPLAVTAWITLWLWMCCVPVEKDARRNLYHEAALLVLCCLQRLCVTTCLVVPMAEKNGAQEGGIGCDMHIYIWTCRCFRMNEGMVLTRAPYAVPG